MDEMAGWFAAMLVVHVAVGVGSFVSHVSSSIQLGNIRRELEELKLKK